MEFEVEDVLLLGFMLCATVVQYRNLNSQKHRRRRNRKRRYWVHPINKRRQKEGEFATLFSYCLQSSHDQFFAYTRLEAWHFEALLDMLRPFLTKQSNRKPLSPAFRLALTLKFLAHGGSMQSIAWNFRIGRSTARKVIQETCHQIWEVVGSQYVVIPSSEEEWCTVAADFWDIWNFPNCIGALDGKHIAIEAPPGSGSEYFNYKQFNSIVLMATCDAHYQFQWVDVGSIGSKSDGGIFSESTFGRELMQDKIALPEGCLPGTSIVAPYWFVADEAFPLKQHIMRPYPGRNLEDSKRIFNYRLSRARRTIENSFGILVARWRILQNKISGVPKTAESYVLAAVALHNYVMSTRVIENSRYCPEQFVDREENGILLPGEWRNIVGCLPHADLGRVRANNPAKVNVVLRNTLSDYLVEEGNVPWQYETINRGWGI